MASPLPSNPGLISGRLAGQVNDGEGAGRSPRIWASRGVWAETTRKGAGKALGADMVANAAAGQKAAAMMSNQILALSQVFPL